MERSQFTPWNVYLRMFFRPSEIFSTAAAAVSYFEECRTLALFALPVGSTRYSSVRLFLSLPRDLTHLEPRWWQKVGSERVRKVYFAADGSRKTRALGGDSSKGAIHEGSEAHTRLRERRSLLREYSLV